MPPAGWVLAVLALAATVAVALYWLLVSTEGAYLGPRVVTRLYDRYASRYDRVKEYDERYERHFVGEPVARFLAERAEESPQPVWILDVATGTGRFVQAVLQSDGRDTRFVCLDSSRPMLAQARQNLENIAADGQVVFLQHDAATLPFVDNAFAIVSCLEALEFMPAPLAVIVELVRVTRPAGLLVMTNRVGWQSYLFPGRRYGREQLADLLRKHGCSYVSITPWQVDYDRVLAVKDPAPAAAIAQGDWPEMTRCSRCTQAAMVAQEAGLRCSHCGAEIVEVNGIWQLS